VVARKVDESFYEDMQALCVQQRAADRAAGAARRPGHRLPSEFFVRKPGLREPGAQCPWRPMPMNRTHLTMSSLPDVLASHRNEVMQRWLEEVRGTLHPLSMPRLELVDHLPAFLDQMI
jgi:hypothetical protein